MSCFWLAPARSPGSVSVTSAATSDAVEKEKR